MYAEKLKKLNKKIDYLMTKDNLSLKDIRKLEAAFDKQYVLLVAIQRDVHYNDKNRTLH